MRAFTVRADDFPDDREPDALPPDDRAGRVSRVRGAGAGRLARGALDRCAREGDWLRVREGDWVCVREGDWLRVRGVGVATRRSFVLRDGVARPWLGRGVVATRRWFVPVVGNARR